MGCDLLQLCVVCMPSISDADAKEEVPDRGRPRSMTGCQPGDTAVPHARCELCGSLDACICMGCLILEKLPLWRFLDGRSVFPALHQKEPRGITKLPLAVAQLLLHLFGGPPGVTLESHGTALANFGGARVLWRLTQVQLYMYMTRRCALGFSCCISVESNKSPSTRTPMHMHAASQVFTTAKASTQTLRLG